MGKSLYALHILSARRLADCLISFWNFPSRKSALSQKIDELHEDNIRLTREVSEQEHKIAIESERRRTAGVEANQLKVTIQQLQMDNEKLEEHISEWKLIAEESKSNADKYCREINKIFTALEEVKSVLSCTCTEVHLR